MRFGRKSILDFKIFHLLFDLDSFFMVCLYMSKSQKNLHFCVPKTARKCFYVLWHRKCFFFIWDYIEINNVREHDESLQENFFFGLF